MSTSFISGIVPKSNNRVMKYPNRYLTRRNNCDELEHST